MNLPGLGDIEDAAESIRGVASVTPLRRSPALSRLFGLEVFLKLECYQPIRVFKIRGAYNKIRKCSTDGVVAASSGNHGIAVSYSAMLLGKKCKVVVPETVVEEKAASIQEFGGEVIRFGRRHSERYEMAQKIARESDYDFVHPFNDADVIAGQGTCGLEIAEQAPDVDSVIVPVGGGGLISGISIAIKSSSADIQVFGAEPEGAPKMQRALAARSVQMVDNPYSIADGLMTSSVGELTLAATARNVKSVMSVTDDEIITATKLLVREARVFCEPSGAAPIAFILAMKKRGELGVLGKKTVAVISGGNVSLSLLKQLLEGPLVGAS